MSIDRGMGKDVVHIYNGQLLCHKNEIPFEATWMDLEIIILSEVSHIEKDKYHDVTYTWNLIKMIQMNLQNRFNYLENLWLPKGKWGGNKFRSLRLTYTHYLIQSSVNGHLGCFHVLVLL